MTKSLSAPIYIFRNILICFPISEIIFHQNALINYFLHKFFVLKSIPLSHQKWWKNWYLANVCPNLPKLNGFSGKTFWTDGKGMAPLLPFIGKANWLWICTEVLRTNLHWPNGHQIQGPYCFRQQRQEKGRIICVLNFKLNFK
jgi:hypothetical protein